MPHYEERLQHDIDEIRSQIRWLSAAISTAISDAVRALLTGDLDLASRTVLNDLPINRATRRLDRACHAFVAKHLPSAGHLRFISSVMRISVALERIGDYAVTVSREAIQLNTRPSPTLLQDAETMSDQAKECFDLAIAAFLAQDEAMARNAMALPGRLTAAFDGVFRDLVRDAEDGGRPVADSFALLVVMNRLERISDQAKNICEEAVFAVTGKTKEPRVYRVLFVDEHDDRSGQMAVAIAGKAYPGSGAYASGGWEPASEIAPDVRSFLDSKGFDVGNLAPKSLRTSHDDLAEIHVVVDLHGDARERIPRLPFHTVLLRWELPATESLEELHRELSGRVQELVELLRGSDAP